MKKIFVPIVIAIVLFSIPFFWLKPGFVDLGGDAGRLYFLDPLGALRSIFSYISSAYAYGYSHIPYYFFLYLLKSIVRSPTVLIAIEHGLQLSLSFLGMYLVVREILLRAEKQAIQSRVEMAGIISGFLYVGFIAKTGWTAALPTLNQTFLNVCMFYLFLRYACTRNFLYLVMSLWMSVIFSPNFSVGHMPQLASFYPLAMVFLYLYVTRIYRHAFPWKGFILFFLFFLGLHMFHLLPVFLPLFTAGSNIHTQIFSAKTIFTAGLDYFLANHADSGKISKELFQWWIGKRVFAIFIPFVVIAGFFHTRSKLLALIGIFFVITFFLVSANITQAGIALYTSLFHIPGFAMFRSFNEKWHYVNSFFFVLLFGVSFYYVFAKRKLQIWMMAGCIILVTLVLRLYPFLRGDAVRTTLHLSDNVPATFSIDPHLVEAIEFVKTLPKEGKVLTLPLTFPYFQVAYGKEGGAYEGISLIANLAGRQDFPGFWTFGEYETPIFSAFLDSDIDALLQRFSLLNIRYVFRNSDPRIMEKFPIYPYLDSGTYARKDQFPLLADQGAYNRFLAQLPLKKLFEKGSYEVYEIEDRYVRPLMYVPDYISSHIAEAPTDEYRWAYADGAVCLHLVCDVQEEVPNVTYNARSPSVFDIRIDLKSRKSPFLLVMSHTYNQNLDIIFPDISNAIISAHVPVNGYANGWIIDPSGIDNASELRGVISLRSQRYLHAGGVFSSISFALLVIFTARVLLRTRYGKT